MKKSLAFAMLVLTSVVSMASEPINWDALIARRVRIANQILDQRMNGLFPIPKAVVDKSQCVAVVRAVKVGFTWGGEAGTGLVSCKNADGWGSPTFLDVGNVSYGWQEGAQLMDTVTMFMTDGSRQLFTHPEIEIGVDASFAVGPVGQGISVGLLPDAVALTYDHGIGLYAGATIDGWLFIQGRHRNEIVYGDQVGVAEILGKSGNTAPAAVKPFVDALNKNLKYN